ncbi:hypothetical protein QFC22_006331 [Naganishia vaughanmartiniae]|uniref:Uncharacterized protein n=1 Tax=Naganishia vaughanmartiniae TaxID=1424756 RepID=A0ACC2WP14_9TREE|nr:hypothetical protein QFC22_006331 [Naganishia vaughanmartiniae]
MAQETETKKARKARAVSEESEGRSDSEPPVVEPKKRKQAADTRAELQEDVDDIAPAPKRRTPATKPVYKEESSVSDDSRPKKTSSSQPLGERVDSVANTAAGKTSNTNKASLAGKKVLPATIMEESESEEPRRPKASSSTGKDEKSAATLGGEKKKKRKLGALLGGTTFTWDQNLNPDGPIPASLSPLKSSAGSIPRAGFAGGMSRKFPSRV